MSTQEDNMKKSTEMHVQGDDGTAIIRMWPQHGEHHTQKALKMSIHPNKANGGQEIVLTFKRDEVVKFLANVMAVTQVIASPHAPHIRQVMRLVDAGDWEGAVKRQIETTGMSIEDASKSVGGLFKIKADNGGGPIDGDHIDFLTATSNMKRAFEKTELMAKLVNLISGGAPDSETADIFKGDDVEYRRVDPKNMDATDNDTVNNLVKGMGLDPSMVEVTEIDVVIDREKGDPEAQIRDAIAAFTKDKGVKVIGAVALPHTDDPNHLTVRAGTTPTGRTPREPEPQFVKPAKPAEPKPESFGEPQKCPHCVDGKVQVMRNAKGEIDYIDGTPSGEEADCQYCGGEGTIDA